MQNVEWIDMLRVLPLDQQNTIVLVLKNQAEIAVDSLYRFETNFLVVRGRVGGTTDEGRAFFIPYDQMVYYRIERVVNQAELQIIFDGQPERTTAPVPDASAPAPTPSAPTPSAPTPSTPPAPQPAEPAPNPAATAQTDATATRNALLDRIRAARAPTGNR